MFRAVALLLLASSANADGHLRDLKGGKDDAACDMLQGVPIYKKYGGYASYGEFTTAKGKIKDMTYPNLIQEYANYADAVLKNNPDADLNADQPYENLHIAYAETPSIIDPSKWIFLSIGPYWELSSFVFKDDGGEGPKDKYKGYSNFLDWHLGPRRYEILDPDGSLEDNEAVAHSLVYQDASISASFFLFFQDRKFTVKVNGCKIAEPLSKLAKADAFDTSNKKKLRYTAYTAFFVLIPPGLPSDVYESLGVSTFAKYFPPNSYETTDFVLESERPRTFCVGEKAYCEDKLKGKRLLGDSSKPASKRTVVASGVGYEAFDIEY